MAAYFPLAPEPLAYGVWVFPREVFGQSGEEDRHPHILPQSAAREAADADFGRP